MSLLGTCRWCGYAFTEFDVYGKFASHDTCTYAQPHERECGKAYEKAQNHFDQMSPKDVEAWAMGELFHPCVTKTRWPGYVRHYGEIVSVRISEFRWWRIRRGHPVEQVDLSAAGSGKKRAYR